MLLEGVPGLGKTELVKALSRVLDLDFRRIQFTPDLMPADIIGTNIMIDRRDGPVRFEFRQGPIFTQLLLADEINRATPKTQSALLETMQEGIGHDRRARSTCCKQPFFVLATQNPIEQEGTYPLPEAQLDRFLFKVEVPFLNRGELNEVVSRTILKTAVELPKLLDSDRIMELRTMLDKVVVADRCATSPAARAGDASPYANSRPKRSAVHPLGRQPARRAGPDQGRPRPRPRQGRAHVAFEDIRHFRRRSPPHRVLLNYDGQAENLDINISSTNAFQGPVGNNVSS